MTLVRHTAVAALLAVLVLCGLGPLAGSALAQDAGDPELMLLRTTGGDILIELLDQAAPTTVTQITAVVEAGGFDGVPFVRVIPDFIVQAGQVEVHRRPPATTEQLDLITNLPLETSTEFKHVRGAVSLARFDEPTSGTTSLSILVQDSPHLDGDYAVFGSVVDGMDVVDLLNRSAVDVSDKPVQSIEIWQAQIGPESTFRAIEGLRTTPSASTSEWFASVPGIATGSTVAATSGTVTTRTTSAATTAALVAAAVFGIAAFLFAGRIEPRFVGALGLLAALAAGFGLFAAVVPSDNPLTAVLFFGALIGFFRLLSRFEAVRPAGDKSSAPAPHA